MAFKLLVDALVSEKKVHCWGDCGKLLVFRHDTTKPKSCSQPYEADYFEKQQLVRHSCKQNRSSVFLEAMVNFSTTLHCKHANKTIYAIPTIRGMVWFENLHPWKPHSCPDHNLGVLPEIDVFQQKDLFERAQCLWPNSDSDIDIAVICSQKNLGAPHSSDPIKKYLVALKSITGKRMCLFIDGSKSILSGELIAISHRSGRLITANSLADFKIDCIEKKPELLGLPHSWMHSQDASPLN